MYILEVLLNLKKKTMIDREQFDEDPVNHPSHYESWSPSVNIQAIDCMRAAFGDDRVKDFCICNAMKYIYRCYSKGENQDIEKAQWYLNKFLELGGCE